VLQLGNHVVADYWQLDVAVVAPAVSGSVVVGGSGRSLVVVCWFDDDGSCGGGGQAVLVGGDVLIRRRCSRVDYDRAHFGSVDVGRDAEVEVGLRAGDRHMDMGGALAVDSDRRGSVGRRWGGISTQLHRQSHCSLDQR
jgi:hypothetical protein